jgi:signal transduction histidine kinase/uncharacterized membrane protein affecting hemolysin expression
MAASAAVPAAGHAPISAESPLREPWFRRLPVKWKLVLIIMAITSACLALVGFGVAVNDRFAVRREMVDRLSTMAEIIGANSTAALAFRDEKAATETLQALEAERFIVVAAIYDGPGAVFARFDRNPERRRELPAAPAMDDEHRFEGRELSVQKAISLGGRRIGTVHLRAETRQLEERLARFLAAAGVLFVGSLFLSFMLSARLQKVVTDPILQLVNTAQEVSRSKDYGLRASGAGSDELGVLIASFNRMLSEIEKRDAAQRFLAEAGVALSRSLDATEIMQEAVRLPVPALADGSAIEGIDATGEVHRVAEIGAGVSSELECARVPLQVRDRKLGALILCCVPPRTLTEEDRAVAEEVGRRAAVALENARLYREAQEAVSARDAFLSMASHELKTPLTALLMEVQLSLRMARRGKEGALAPERMTAKLETLERLAHQLRKLIGNLLDVSRIQAGRLDLERGEMDFVALVREVIERAEADLARAGSTVTIEAPEKLVGLWDRLRLDQVVTNLVANASKYGSGKPIVVRLERAGQEARLSVTDQGIGISPDDQKRIFERFERAVSTQHYAGFGLGLWIVRQIVEAHGGTIAVESTPGTGATFTVALPVG